MAQPRHLRRIQRAVGGGSETRLQQVAAAHACTHSVCANLHRRGGAPGDWNPGGHCSAGCSLAQPSPGIAGPHQMTRPINDPQQRKAQCKHGVHPGCIHRSPYNLHSVWGLRSQPACVSAKVANESVAPCHIRFCRSCQNTNRRIRRILVVFNPIALRPYFVQPLNYTACYQGIQPLDNVQTSSLRQCASLKQALTTLEQYWPLVCVAYKHTGCPMQELAGACGNPLH